MKRKIRLFGSLFMVFGILLGALGSHYFKRILSVEGLESFKVGLRYLIYHGLGLLLLSGMGFKNLKEKKRIFYLMLWGTLIFSGSIFLLSFKNFLPFSITFLGPITPVGGIALILAWSLMVIAFLKKGN
tara:strand:- start:1384 stop:1770 length:387 start_codon:yes stop_codon:yes gene_type:complete